MSRGQLGALGKLCVLVGAVLVKTVTAVNVDCDVAVIGGGAAGANAAVFLKDKGLEVCLFEAQKTLGGHCSTVRFTPPAGVSNPQNFVDIGVVVYGNSSYWQSTEPPLGDWTLKTDAHLERFAPGTIKTFALSGTPSATYRVDLAHPVGLQDATPTAAQQQATGAAFFRFLGYLATLPWLETAGSYPDPIPPELLVPFSEFITANGFEALVDTVFAGLLYQGGKGPFDKLTTLYALENLRRGNLLLTATPSGMVATAGCQKIYDGIQDFLGSRVYLNAEILSVSRPPKNKNLPSTIIVGVGGENQARQFKAAKVVISIPQTLDNLKPFGLDARETAAFENVRVRGYYASAVDIAGGSLADATFTLVNRDLTDPLTPVIPGPRTVCAVYRELPYGPASCYAASTEPLPSAAAKAFIEAQLANLPPEGVADASLSEFNSHVFQPHFTAEALAASPSPFTVLAQQQGYRNTYYVGALLSFAESAKVMEHAYRVVSEFF
eukprot:TRINITY_DN12791_c0_g1_i1.p1 TRINITY_DN12791_c0_g1~~TRINITY_DN12791_c0_g1_i1.p1  ORF type:complete len:495 (+),score=142.26 TRINITY_DN12791_c0_g1_i1:3168-4652(+)